MLNPLLFTFGAVPNRDYLWAVTCCCWICTKSAVPVLSVAGLGMNRLCQYAAWQTCLAYVTVKSDDGIAQTSCSNAWRIK